PELMHGGPPSALLVRACEQAAGEGMVALRASVDFLSPVPVGPVEVVARVVRAGRRIALTEAVLEAGGRSVLQARVWHVRLVDEPTPALDQQPPADVPSPDRATPMTGWTFPYARALEWRTLAGDPLGAGPATVWTRALIPVVPGEEPSGLQRAVLSADSGNGVSSGLDWNAWSFVNIDLDVHLSRPLVGEWVLLDAASRYEESGTGLAASSLWDERGRVGRGVQTLVVTPRPA
ncbi:MAG TPA: thioesterase family protein, partial [Kineosporiaceae bacterium]|nr:thioesterase family protein [Kineosporiaceae bacterium]